MMDTSHPDAAIHNKIRNKFFKKKKVRESVPGLLSNFILLSDGSSIDCKNKPRP